MPCCYCFYTITTEKSLLVKSDSAAEKIL
jgi:hypothetical protein